jgi:hypothetical protein
MLHTGTGNDLQAFDDFLSLYELYKRTWDPIFHDCIAVPPTAHPAVAIGLLITFSPSPA